MRIEPGAPTQAHETGDGPRNRDGSLRSRPMVRAPKVRSRAIVHASIATVVRAPKVRSRATVRASMVRASDRPRFDRPDREPIARVRRSRSAPRRMSKALVPKVTRSGSEDRGATSIAIAVIVLASIATVARARIAARRDRSRQPQRRTATTRFPSSIALDDAGSRRPRTGRQRSGSRPRRRDRQLRCSRPSSGDASP